MADVAFGCRPGTGRFPKPATAADVHSFHPRRAKGPVRGEATRSSAGATAPKNQHAVVVRGA